MKYLCNERNKILIFGFFYVASNLWFQTVYPSLDVVHCRCSVTFS